MQFVIVNVVVSFSLLYNGKLFIQTMAGLSTINIEIYCLFVCWLYFHYRVAILYHIGWPFLLVFCNFFFFF